MPGIRIGTIALLTALFGIVVMVGIAASKTSSSWTITEMQRL